MSEKTVETHTAETMPAKLDASIWPERSLEILSPLEVQQLMAAHDTPVYQTFRRCALAVLNTGSEIDDPREILRMYHDFDIQVDQQSRGVKLVMKNAPASAFVDGQIIKGIKHHLFSVLRDIIYVEALLPNNPLIQAKQERQNTDLVSRLLRNANVLQAGNMQKLVVCWGGHSIGRAEYEYTKDVGYSMGLRGCSVITGCGPGAMKGPMKGATIAHAKQHMPNRRYIGLTEPGIVASEPPNPIVNELVILPDIEKRLEAFVRFGHAILVFPGGAGTAEEVLYLMGLLMHPDNIDIPLPVILTAPEASKDYWSSMIEFLRATIGEKAVSKLKVIVNDPEEVARAVNEGIQEVEEFRRENKDAFYFNWKLKVPLEFQKPFIPTHENMAQLELHKDQKPHELAANLRRAFSGIVSGNVKEEGVSAIEEHGPFEISGDPEIMNLLDNLLRDFVAQGRMKIGGGYKPCYKIVTGS